MNLPRCPDCPSVAYCPIPTDGPKNAEVLVYGERPGQQEEFAAEKAVAGGCFRLEGQNCFIGDAGDEFNENYLRFAGLERRNVRVGNTVLCGSNGNKHPTGKQARACADFHIAKDCAETPSLKLVILMGGVAASLVDGLDLESEHGIPRWVEDWFGWSGWVVPMYHPAAGLRLRQTSYMIPLFEDWERLGRWIKTGERQWPLDRYPEHDFRLARSAHEVKRCFDEYVWFLNMPELIGADSERHGAQPFSLQVSARCGTGLMVLERDEEAMVEFARCLGECLENGAELVMHNAPADLEPFLRHLRDTGIHSFPYRDTMQELYHLGLFLQQGLKIAALRVLGRKRQSWEEVVGEASRQKLIAWLWEALGVAEGWRAFEPRTSLKTGRVLKPTIMKHPAEAEVWHLLTYTTRSAEYKSWEKIAELGWPGSEWFKRLEQEVGWTVPVKGIGNCELRAAVDYGCQDASDALELALVLRQLRKSAVEEWDVQPEDVDECVGSPRVGVVKTAVI